MTDYLLPGSTEVPTDCDHICKSGNPSYWYQGESKLPPNGQGVVKSHWNVVSLKQIFSRLSIKGLRTIVPFKLCRLVTSSMYKQKLLLEISNQQHTYTHRYIGTLQYLQNRL